MPDALPPAAICALLAAGGLAAVLVGALALRVHALIVLTVAGLAVMWLTPRANVVRAEVEADAERFVVRGVGEWGDDTRWMFPAGDRWADPPGSLTMYRPHIGGGLGEPVASLRRFTPSMSYSGPDTIEELFEAGTIDGRTLVRTDYGDFLVGRPSATPTRFFGALPVGKRQAAAARREGLDLLEPGDLLVSPAELTAANAVADLPPPARFARAFGHTAASIGLLIALAAVLGAGLTHSGAAERLVRALLGVVGPRGHPAAFCAGALALGVPVFFDAVVLLCAPLAKSTALRTGRGVALLLLAACCGAALTQSLVPPTPGPLLVAAELGVSIPRMIAVGLGVSLVAAPIGLLWCVWWCRRRERVGKSVPVRDGAGASLDHLRDLAGRPLHELPPLWASLAPLAAPVFLIAQRSAWEPFADRVPWVPDVMTAVVRGLGDPTIAVLAGALCSLMLLWRYAAPAERREVVAAAVAEGGGIVLLASAGGAFGAALRQTGVGGLVAATPTAGGLGLLVLAWAITVAVRTAQGSATVAMVVAAGLVAAALPGSGVHPVWAACAIGCGSKAIAWQNSSGFWVVCRAGGLTEGEALATFTPLTIVLAVVGLLVTLAGAWLWPMV